MSWLKLIRRHKEQSLLKHPDLIVGTQLTLHIISLYLARKPNYDVSIVWGSLRSDCGKEFLLKKTTADADMHTIRRNCDVEMQAPFTIDRWPRFGVRCI